MRRIALLLSTLLAVGVASPTSTFAADPAPSSPAPAPDFAALVKKGDQARIAGKWSVALEAYSNALEIRPDPLVAGRLGLVLNEFREYDVAAGKLLLAIEKGAGANDVERTRFFQAYLIAKNQACRLDVTIDQNRAKFEIDGEPWLDGSSEFWTFVKPGKHKLRVSLEGFEDETREIDATKGGQIPLAFSLRPVKPAEEPAKKPDPEPEPLKSESKKPEEKPVPEVKNDKPLPPTNSTRNNGSFVVGFGAGFVFGATPTPAVGPNLFGAWRSRSWWEVGVDARAAWTFGKDELSPNTQFVTWSAMFVPCGRWRNRLLGCLLAQIDGVARDDGSNAGLLPGFGLRGGVEFKTHAHVDVQLLGDLALHPRGFTFRLPGSTVSSTGSSVTGSLAIRMIIKP